MTTEDPFEHLAVRFVATAARLVPAYLISLIFASPLSARSPDLCLFWHSGYRSRHKASILVGLLGKVLVGLVKGLAKWVFKVNPYGYALYGSIKETLLVTPYTCGEQTTEGRYKTPYVYTDQNHGVFVFGPHKSLGDKAQEGATISFIATLSSIVAFTNAGMVAFFAVKGNLFDRFLLLLEWCSWVFGLTWVNDYLLEESLSSVVSSYNIAKIGCVHEMHSYSRIVWQVAQKHNAIGYTVQHASISVGKRWYFPYPQERDCGLALPHVFYVYDESVAELLKPYYEKTRFLLGCSCRYAHWISLLDTDTRGGGQYYLFVGALAYFDNKVLISALQNLINHSDDAIRIRLRLHPSANLNGRMRRWIQDQFQRGLIDLSNGTSLREDIGGAATVIGMSTTVLEEALLLGCPVVQLAHLDYLAYVNLNGVPGVVKIESKKLSVDLLKSVKPKTNTQHMRRRLGLNQPLITYDRLFSPTLDQRQLKFPV